MSEEAKSAPKLIAQIIVQLTDNGEMKFSLPQNKRMAVKMLLQALEGAAMMPNEEEKSHIVKPGMILGGLPTQRVS